MKSLKIRGTPVLFTEQDSVYKKIGCDCYDVKRDARTFKGGKAAIYHPPCRLFSKMSKLSKAPLEEKKLAYWAVEMIRAHGGILEHPENSKLWRELDLPVPGQPAKGGGVFSCNRSILIWSSLPEKNLVAYFRLFFKRFTDDTGYNGKTVFSCGAVRRLGETL